MSNSKLAVVIQAVDFAAAKAFVIDKLAQNGFGVLWEIPMDAVLKKKVDFDMEEYTILGSCNPKLAKRAVVLNRDVGLFLPCNTVVRKVDDGYLCQILDPDVGLNVFTDEQLANDPTLPADAMAAIVKVVDSWKEPATETTTETTTS